MVIYYIYNRNKVLELFDGNEILPSSKPQNTSVGNNYSYNNTFSSKVNEYNTYYLSLSKNGYDIEVYVLSRDSNDALPIRIDSNENIYYKKITNVNNPNKTTTSVIYDVILFASEPISNRGFNHKPLFCTPVQKSIKKMYYIYYIVNDVNTYLAEPPTTDKTKALKFSLHMIGS